MRARAAACLAVLVTAGWLPPAAAAECVKVVVDYGTVSGYGTPPGGTNTRCVTVDDGAVAAKAIEGRARYKGNFLCALDGYPGTQYGCGDHGTEPYWSIWVFQDGRWTYSSEGVATLRVTDRDGDGHPDPLGFRYVAYDGRAAPRANPAYPKPAATTKPPAPPRTTAPAAPGRPRATTAPPAPPAGGGTTTTAPAAPGATGTPSAPAGSATARATAASGSPGSPASSDPATSVDPSVPPAAAEPADTTSDRFPWGTVAVAVVALGLLGVTAYRFSRPAAQ
jgi:hypothetical protein